MKPTRRFRLPLLLPIAVMGFLYVPIAVVMLFSFNVRNSLVSFGGLSTRWYHTLFADGSLWSSVLLSAEIAAITTVFAVPLGTALSIGLERLRGRAGAVGTAVLAMTLITPEVALGFSLLLVFTTLGLQLSTVTIIIGHITFSLVYVTVVVQARLAQLRADVEEAAQDLGATRWQTLRLAVLPQLTSAIVGSAMLVFVISFDDFVTSFFVSGVGTSTLPVLIYSMIRFGVTPEVNAVATLMLVVSLGLGVLGFLLTRREWFTDRSGREEVEAS
jgi:spermidine/putrescine transport system permease protein